MKKKKWSGERLETFILTRDAVDHLHRYAIAKTYVKNKKVLDIASGEGYGSNLLSEEASYVFGVDIDTETIEKAKLKYRKSNLSFQQGTTSSIPLEDNTVDVVVSFETIEHHDEHDEMMSEITRVLKPEGIVIISTPDKYYYSDAGSFKNEFHIKELYKDEFENLISKSFSNVQLLTQKYIDGNSIIQDEKSGQDIRFFNGNFSKIKEEEGIPMYLITIASDGVFENQSSSIFNELEFAKENNELMISNIRKSTTFRIGYIILWPFQYIKRLFK
jgi:ubiquinone/menaquinone biosynthesis C-methylase UbiE